MSEFDIDSKPIAIELPQKEKDDNERRQNRYQTIGIVKIPEFPCNIKTVNFITAKKRIELVLIVEDFSVESGKESIYGEYNGKNSVGGVLMLAGKQEARLVAHMEIMPEEEEKK